MDDSRQTSQGSVDIARVSPLLQIVGTGYPKEMFYTDNRVKQAYRNYVYMLLMRINTYTGVQYWNDPTIFSFELMVAQHLYSLLDCFP